MVRVGTIALIAVPFMVIALVHWMSRMPRTNAGRRMIDAQPGLLQARRLASQVAAAQQGLPERPHLDPVLDEMPRSKGVLPPSAVDNSTPAVVATPAASTASPTAACAETRKPFHVLLTATAQTYQQWQCRVMYFHWRKQRDADPLGACTEMTGFTRLVASAGGRPDGLENEIPSAFVREYSGAEAAKFHGYRVVNRPYSVVQFLQTAAWKAIPEKYVYIAETDHVLMHVLPNKATPGSPMAYVFNYMGPNPAHAGIIKNAWPEGGSDGWRKVQSIGPSPVVIHKDDLERVAAPWNDISVALKTNPEADSRLGWVIEMWGYAIAAAKVGLKHQEFRNFQVEPGGNSGGEQLRDFEKKYWVFHYTYQFETMLDGTPCKPWTIGEFSLDKRHFSDQYPTPPLPQPPKGSNVAAYWLTNAFNEAMEAIPNWPRRQPPAGQRPVQTVYGRRRLDWFGRHANGFATELRMNPLVKQLAGTSWLCSGAWQKLVLTETGDSRGGETPDGRGRWATMNDPTLGDEACPVYHCLYVDVRGRQHNVRVNDAGDELVVYAAHDMRNKIATCKRA
eukprot:Transcript_22745.p1 GENE.Transcript_22745~~Transcript_22745.p1  ORF type:complete len:563 (+),score=217.62 Transcript_22745:349-2037(+)